MVWYSVQKTGNETSSKEKSWRTITHFKNERNSGSLDAKYKVMKSDSRRKTASLSA